MFLFVGLGLSFGRSFPEKQLLSNQCFSVIYDNKLLIPIFSHNEVTVKDINNVHRRIWYTQDKRVNTATNYMYSLSRYDRGHLVSAKETSSSNKCYSDSFKYSNIVPMTPLCNRKYWKHTEELVNSLVILNNEKVVVFNYVIPSKSRLKEVDKYPIIPKAFIKNIIIEDRNISLCFKIPNLKTEEEYKTYLKKNTSFRCVLGD